MIEGNIKMESCSTGLALAFGWHGQRVNPVLSRDCLMSYQIRPARAADNEAILSLLQGTLARRSYPEHERQPDYFRGAKVTCEQPDVWVAEPRDARGNKTWVGGACGSMARFAGCAMPTICVSIRIP